MNSCTKTHCCKKLCLVLFFPKPLHHQMLGRSEMVKSLRAKYWTASSLLASHSPNQPAKHQEKVENSLSSNPSANDAELQGSLQKLHLKGSIQTSLAILGKLPAKLITSRRNDTVRPQRPDFHASSRHKGHHRPQLEQPAKKACSCIHSQAHVSA